MFKELDAGLTVLISNSKYTQNTGIFNVKTKSSLKFYL